jgi:hypothetical protein
MTESCRSVVRAPIVGKMRTRVKIDL